MIFKIRQTWRKIIKVNEIKKGLNSFVDCDHKYHFNERTYEHISQFFSFYWYLFRRTRSQLFFKICFFKTFCKFWVLDCWSLFLKRLQAFRRGTLLKRDSNTCVFVWNLRIFLEQLFFSRMPLVAASVLRFLKIQGLRKVVWTIIISLNNSNFLEGCLS